MKFALIFGIVASVFASFARADGAIIHSDPQEYDFSCTIAGNDLHKKPVEVKWNSMTGVYFFVTPFFRNYTVLVLSKTTDFDARVAGLLYTPLEIQGLQTLHPGKKNEQQINLFPANCLNQNSVWCEVPFDGDRAEITFDGDRVRLSCFRTKTSVHE